MRVTLQLEKYFLAFHKREAYMFARLLGKEKLEFRNLPTKDKSVKST